MATSPVPPGRVAVEKCHFPLADARARVEKIHPVEDAVARQQHVRHDVLEPRRLHHVTRGAVTRRQPEETRRRIASVELVAVEEEIAFVHEEAADDDAEKRAGERVGGVAAHLAGRGAVEAAAGAQGDVSVRHRCHGDEK